MGCATTLLKRNVDLLVPCVFSLSLCFCASQVQQRTKKRIPAASTTGILYDIFKAILSTATDH